MAARPRVGVTGDGRRVAPSWWCIWLALRLVGASPQRISVRHRGADPADLDALIVSGGNDIGPELYGGNELPKAKIDRERDSLEVYWIRQALRRKLPILGICRGAQLLNVVLGGSLIQDIRSLRVHTSNRASLAPRKAVRLSGLSRLARVIGRRTVRVNSLHHQAIDVPGRDLEPVARDRDDICQAIEATGEHRVFGVQWHPEYLLYLPSQLRLFRWVAQEAT